MQSVRKEMQITGVRRIDRAVAKENMKTKGLKKFCKHSYIVMNNVKTVVPSKFASEWKNYITI